MRKLVVVEEAEVLKMNSMTNDILTKTKTKTIPTSMMITIHLENQTVGQDQDHVTRNTNQGIRALATTDVDDL